MSKQLLTAGLIAVGVVALGLGALLIGTSKNRMQLQGDVLKVRSREQDPEHTIALLDVRLTNPSTQQVMVREVEVFVDEPDGKSTAAEVFTDVDAKRVVDYYKTLGQMYSPSLIRHDKINAGQTADRTITVSVPMSDERLAARKRIRIKVADVDGAVLEISEHTKK